MFGVLARYLRTRTYYKTKAELYQQEYLELAEEYVRYLEKQAGGREIDTTEGENEVYRLSELLAAHLKRSKARVQ